MLIVSCDSGENKNGKTKMERQKKGTQFQRAINNKRS